MQLSDKPGPPTDGWSTSHSASSKQHVRPVSRALQVVSGNRQGFGADREAAVKNPHPRRPLRVSSSCSETKSSPNKQALDGILRSHSSQANIDRIYRRQRRPLNHHRQHGSSSAPGNQDRSYLLCESFLDYRDRQRKDLGKDGKQIWSDRVENAFQEALLYVECMSMQHRSKTGRPLGRNQLISQYIFDKTGESRDRKQVMSHIQVLEPMFVDEPSWRALVPSTGKTKRGDGANPESRRDSIMAQAKQQRRLPSQLSTYHEDGGKIYAGHLPPPPQTLGSNGFGGDGRRIVGVKFEMWMSPNNGRMDEKLHYFTSIQSAQGLPRCSPTPLEDVRNWRSSYPSLAQLVDANTYTQELEIIMVETSYKGISDFPAPKSSLGSDLKLILGSRANSDALDWMCTVHLYRNGVRVKDPSHFQLSPNGGRISPPFEPQWWAKLFVDQLDQRREAEEQGDHDVYRAAQEEAERLFAGLTAVHEIRAGSRVSGSRNDMQVVAVLLWKFSLTPEPYVGTTSWWRLLAPPARVTSNSPAPNLEGISLPSPIAVEGVVNGLHDPTGSINRDFLVSHGGDIQYLQGARSPSQQSSFDFAFQDESMGHFASFQPSFVDSANVEPAGANFGDFDEFHYDLELQTLPTPSQQELYSLSSEIPFALAPVSQSDLPVQGRNHAQGTVYEMPIEEEQIHSRGAVFDTAAEQGHDAEDSTIRRPLANFDHHTHDLLQAQLDVPILDTDAELEEEKMESLSASIVAAPAMNEPSSAPATKLSHHHSLPPFSGPEQAEQAESMSEILWQDVPHQQKLRRQSSFDAAAHDIHDNSYTSVATSHQATTPEPDEQVMGVNQSVYDNASRGYEVNMHAFDMNHTTDVAVASSPQVQHSQQHQQQQQQHQCSHSNVISERAQQQTDDHISNTIDVILDFTDPCTVAGGDL